MRSFLPSTGVSANFPAASVRTTRGFFFVPTRKFSYNRLPRCSPPPCSVACLLAVHLLFVSLFLFPVEGTDRYLSSTLCQSLLPLPQPLPGMAFGRKHSRRVLVSCFIAMAFLVPLLHSSRARKSLSLSPPAIYWIMHGKHGHAKLTPP